MEKIMEEFLDNGLKKQVLQVFEDLKEPVTILFFGSAAQCEFCEETVQLLTEVTALSDLLVLEVHDLEEESELASQYHVDKAPGFVIAGGRGEEIIDFGIRYYGVPAGSEFGALINDLLTVSKRESGLSEETLSFLAGLKEPVHLMIFSTPT
jgi:alkyl hydroperoxide reductase subunit AhpF